MDTLKPPTHCTLRSAPGVSRLCSTCASRLPAGRLTASDCSPWPRRPPPPNGCPFPPILLYLLVLVPASPLPCPAPPLLP
eukprot:scaffold16007_cov16-Tisochrysis_lutea.AAC.3